MYYFYQDTIITVHPGIGRETYATVKRKASGSWETVKTPLMPRTECVATAINNLHRWSEIKKLEKADCGCCWHNVCGKCRKYGKQLKYIEKGFMAGEQNYERCEKCVEEGTY